jgi:hypothetical protein
VAPLYRRRPSTVRLGDEIRAALARKPGEQRAEAGCLMSQTNDRNIAVPKRGDGDERALPVAQVQAGEEPLRLQVFSFRNMQPSGFTSVVPSGK